MELCSPCQPIVCILSYFLLGKGFPEKKQAGIVIENGKDSKIRFLVNKTVSFVINCLFD